MGIRFFVGHGASGSAASMARHVEGLVARGIDAVAIDLPLKKAEAAVPVLQGIVRDGIQGGQRPGGGGAAKRGRARAGGAAPARRRAPPRAGPVDRAVRAGWTRGSRRLNSRVVPVGHARC